MKIWGVLCLFCFINHLNAGIIDTSDRSDKDERSGVGVATHFEEDASEGPLKEQKDLSSFLKENSESAISSKEEIEKPEAFLIVTTAEKSTPPGGGLRLIDPNIINEQIVFPAREVPWWERWWRGVKALFYGEDSDS